MINRSIICTYYALLIGQTQTPVPHVSFSIIPNTEMMTRQNSHVTVFWQVIDEECRDDKWHLKVGTQHQTLLSYPRENISKPIENYTDYNVSAVPGRCESDGQKINVTLTRFVSEHVDIGDYVFCRIRILDPNSNNTSRVFFVIDDDMTTTISTTDPTSVTVTGTIPINASSTSDIPADTTGTSSVAHTKAMHHALLVSIFLALLLYFIY